MSRTSRPNYDRPINELVVTCSIRNMKVYNACLKPSLRKIGCRYTHIITPIELSPAESMNSVIKYTHIRNSRYIMFIHTDIRFNNRGWGARIMKLCDAVPKFGYGGLECCTVSAREVYSYGTMLENRCFNYHFNTPITMETCDGSCAVIPTELFLERQFDAKNFPYYPCKEDYALWIRFVKKKKVVVLPVSFNHGYPHKRQSDHRWGWDTKRNYMVEMITKPYQRLCKKWGHTPNTTACGRNRGVVPNMKKIREAVEKLIAKGKIY